jgi:hypothetical protein
MTRLDQHTWHIKARLVEKQAVDSPATERKQLGQQRLGSPITDTFNALIAAVDRNRGPTSGASLSDTTSAR